MGAFKKGVGTPYELWCRTIYSFFLKKRLKLVLILVGYLKKMNSGSSGLFYVQSNLIKLKIC